MKPTKFKRSRVMLQANAATMCVLIAASLAGPIVIPSSAQSGQQIESVPDDPLIGLHGLRLPVSPVLPPPGASEPLCSSNPSTRAYANLPWPNGVIPFEFDPNVSLTQQGVSMDAMMAIELTCDVRFVPHTTQGGYLYIQDDDENSSSDIGYTGQQVIIKMNSWHVTGIVVHEFLHALGFWHEQVRADRDDFIQVVTGNLQPGSTVARQFMIQPSGLLLGPYDFLSIMHYGECAFSACCPPGFTCNCGSGCETILALPAYAQFQTQMGQRDGLSALDVYSLRAAYPESDWRFVDPTVTGAGSGSGIDPWRDLDRALSQTPVGGTVFVLPGQFNTSNTWDRRLTIASPSRATVR